MKKTTLLAILFAALVLGYLVIASFKRQPYRCEVCIAFEGRSNCATGAAETDADALRTATMTACAEISSGVIQSNQCENTPPASVKWLARK